MELFQNLEILVSKIRQILAKAQEQFNSRQQTIQSGYIEDLRQYNRIVTVCEEQLILTLGEQNLAYLGELIKALSGFHLIILNNLLIWIQQYEIGLEPSKKDMPFEYLIEQSMKEREKVPKINQSRASQELALLGDSINKLQLSSKEIIDKQINVKSFPKTPNMISQETESFRDQIRSTPLNKSMLRKILDMKKLKIDQSCQTQLTILDIQFQQNQNFELQQLLNTTQANLEIRLKEQNVKYCEAKFIMKAQKIEIDHLIALLEYQVDECQKLSSKNTANKILKKFIQIPTIQEKNKRLSISHEKLTRADKNRSASLPKIDKSFEFSNKKIDYLISKNLIPNKDWKELLKKLIIPAEQIKFKKVCSYVGIVLPQNLFDDINDPNKLTTLSHLLQQLKIRHQQCIPKCDHLNFLFS